MTLVERIQDKGYSVREVARMLGKSHGIVYKWSNGESEPAISSFYKLAKILDISPDELYRDITR